VLTECSVGGLALVERMAGYDRVIVLDALQTADPLPGLWHAFDAGAL
jgi:hypothetical protein